MLLSLHLSFPLYQGCAQRRVHGPTSLFPPVSAVWSGKGPWSYLSLSPCISDVVREGSMVLPLSFPLYQQCGQGRGHGPTSLFPLVSGMWSEEGPWSYLSLSPCIRGVVRGGSMVLPLSFPLYQQCGQGRGHGPTCFSSPNRWVQL